MKRRLSFLIAVALLGSGGIACKRARKIPVQVTEEEPDTRLVSTVHVADASSSQQLLKGWHNVEQNAWRWTEGKFSVLLRTPRSGPISGAVLQLKFAVPDPVIEKLKKVTLSAKVNDTALEPETFTKAGEYTFSRQVPAKALKGESVQVDFALDQSLPPGTVDARELGIIAMMVGLEPK